MGVREARHARLDRPHSGTLYAPHLYVQIHARTPGDFHPTGVLSVTSTQFLGKRFSPHTSLVAAPRKESRKVGNLLG